MKRTTLLLLSLSLLPFLTYAQSAIPLPVIKQEGKGYDDFTPKNWNILLIDSGDLNNDLLRTTRSSTRLTRIISIPIISIQNLTARPGSW